MRPLKTIALFVILFSILWTSMYLILLSSGKYTHEQSTVFFLWIIDLISVLLFLKILLNFTKESDLKKIITVFCIGIGAYCVYVIMYPAPVKDPEGLKKDHYLILGIDILILLATPFLNKLFPKKPYKLKYNIAPPVASLTYAQPHVEPKTEHLRGTIIHSWPQVLQKMRNALGATDTELSYLPFGDDRCKIPVSLSHRGTLILGAPRSGKSVVIKQMIAGYQKKGAGGICFDQSDLYSTMCDEKSLLWDLLDARSVRPNIFRDIANRPQDRKMAANIHFPTQNIKEPFFNLGLMKE